MGLYLELPERLNKAAQLIRLHNARAIGQPERFYGGDKVIICVVTNEGPTSADYAFDAAAIVTDPEELRIFSDKFDTRPRKWIEMDRDEVVKMAPYLDDFLLSKGLTIQAWQAPHPDDDPENLYKGR